MSERSTRPSNALVAILCWIAASAYLWQGADERWIPHDEGALAQSAARVAAGEWPHVDFDEIYSGGTSLYHALAFELFGERLVSMRYALWFAVVALFLPAFWSLARRFLSPLGAVAALGVAVVWSFPNYFAPLPSWYNLILATAGLAALARSLDGRSGAWRFVAGLCGGLSIFVKLSGLYFVAGALAFLAFDARRGLAPRDSESRSDGPTALVVWLALGAAGLFVATRLLDRLDGASWWLHFFWPLAALVATAAVVEARDGVPLGPWLRRAARAMLPFALGLAVVLVPWIASYAAIGGLDDLARGLFVLPARRLELASWPPPPLTELYWSLPLALVLVVPRVVGRARWLDTLALVALTGWLVASLASLAGYRAVWAAVRPVGAWIALASFDALVNGARWIEGRTSPSGAPPAPAAVGDRRAASFTFLLAAASATLAWIQVPYAGPIYFCYVAPIFVLAGAHLLLRERTELGRESNAFSSFWRPNERERFHDARLAHSRGLRGVAGGLALALFAFGAFALNTGTQDDLGWGYMRRRGHRPIELERAGLVVHASHAKEYETLVRVLDQVPSGRTIWATPDCPEVYFLAGRENPTRTLFEIFDEREAAAATLRAALEAGELGAIVLNTAPGFSGPPPTDMLEAFAARVDEWYEVGRFRVGMLRPGD